MRFEVLGPLRVTEGDRILRLGEPQQQKLLALLLVAANQSVGTDHLIDEMWGERAPPSSAHLVQVYASNLRRLLADGDDPRIVRDGTGYRIRVLPDELDADRLRIGIADAERLLERRPELADRLLSSTCPSGVGSPLGWLADDSPTLRDESSRLEDLLLRAAELRFEAGLRLGRHTEVLGDLERLTTDHPYREPLWRQRMLALYRAGRQAEALAVAGELRTLLAEDLGIDPSPPIRDLEERILLQDPSILWEPPPPPSNLPEPLTSFVGRRWELGEVVKAVDSHRLVTLTGPGGIGKTRLAIEASAVLIEGFPDGVWWLDLAPLTDPDQVPASLAALLGVVAAPAQATAAAVGSLAPRTALVVIDNCEHLVRAAYRLAAAVLEGTHHVTLLATSRIPLGVAGEVTWSVPGLSLPDPNGQEPHALLTSDAVRLMIERGTDADRTFAFTAANAGAVVEICRRLDALPLGIEMAASRLRSLSPAQVVIGLDDRFALLGNEESEDRRHGTLQATCDWSYRLLDPRSRRVFDRLSVIAGPFDLEAAGAVGQAESEGYATATAVTRLVDASMITLERRGDRVGYRMLETLRQFGLSHLAERGEIEGARDLHARYFLGLAVEAGEHIVTPEFAPWSNKLADADDDLQQALDWSLSHHSRTETLRAAPALFNHWYRVGQAHQAAQWSARMLDGAVDTPAELRAWAHMAATFAANVLGDPDRAGLHSGEALRLLEEGGSVTARVMARYARAQWAFQIGDFGLMERLCRRALSICEEEGRTWDRAGPLSLLGIAVLFDSRDLDEARRLVEQALPLHRRLGHIAGLTTINPLSPIFRMQGDLEAAERAALQASAWATGSGWEAQPLVFLAEAQMDRADLEAARRTLHRALRRALEAGLDIWFRTGVRVLAMVEARSGHADMAARLVGASSHDLPFYAQDPAGEAEVEGIVRTALGDDVAARLQAEGAALADDEVLALVEGRIVVGV